MLQYHGQLNWWSHAELKRSMSGLVIVAEKILGVYVVI